MAELLELKELRLRSKEYERYETRKLEDQGASNSGGFSMSHTHVSNYVCLVV